MAKINLLPWRAERRKQRQKEFYTMLAGAALVAVVIGLGVVKYFDHLIGVQNQRNTRLTSEIALLDEAISKIEALDKRKAELLARKAVIEQLQSSRSQMVHLFDQLVRTIPDGVRLNSIKQTGEKLTLDGVAQSNARVSSYMLELEDSGWMTAPDLSIIEAKGTDKSMPYQFALTVTLKKPKKEGEAEDEVADDAAAGGAP
ncbi:MAG: PilN domain-containing protein [Chiayiivirga sp.]|jgi:type IV pilus assembly protein PilN|uniref:PilN domain-containing protein n=1 Tax=Chiayiivirga sp. TaxID=2041042 RepID=UPI0025C5F9FE|nr:PilN domain-containing protein [Chiayiivirga sp.]MCI1728558.1 PilN domain-containing protein [Chiayiivirga sp.]